MKSCDTQLSQLSTSISDLVQSGVPKCGKKNSSFQSQHTIPRSLMDFDWLHTSCTLITISHPSPSSIPRHDRSPHKPSLG